MDRSSGWIAGYRVLFALLTLGTLIYLMFYNSANVPGFRISNFLSFFTVQSNVFAAVILLCAAAGLTARWQPHRADMIRGAAALYMITTGVVYGVLLAGYTEELNTNLEWADNVVHRVLPVVMAADWLIDPPRTPLRFQSALIWLCYPLAYVVYTLIRGPLAGWYPYPFLDPALVGGYPGVVVASIGIAVFIGLVTWAIVAVGNGQRRLRQGGAAVESFA